MRAFAWLVLFGLLAACTPKPEPELVASVDLLKLPPTSPIVLGEVAPGSAEGQQCLGSGWRKEPFVVPSSDGLQATDSPAEVHFYLLLAADSQVSGRFDYSGQDSFQVGVRCNDSEVGKISLSPGTDSFQLRLPASVLTPGANRLSLQIPTEALPQIVWKRLVFQAENPEARVEDGELLLLPGARSDFYFRAPTAAKFQAQVRFAQANDRLRAELSVAGTEGAREAFFSKDGQSQLDFGAASAGKLCRLTLWGGEQEIRLASPIIAGHPELVVEPTVTPTPGLSPGHPPLVLLVCVDTLRADGVDGPTGAAPRLTRRDFSSFPKATAQSSWTKSTVASMFTGREVLRHGVFSFNARLSNEFVTLAETLRANGYRTVGVYANRWISDEYGYDQGFDVYEKRESKAADLVDRALELLDSHDPKQPLFMYLHFTDPHEPYQPPSRFTPPGASPEAATTERILQLGYAAASGHPDPAAMENLRQLYRGEISYWDNEFERLLTHLESAGLYDRALIVLCSDHGEEFGEHADTLHNNALYQSVLHVPFKVKPPLGRTVSLPTDSVAQSIDIMPTVLALAGCAPEENDAGAMDGRDLTRQSDEALRSRVALSYLQTGIDWERPYLRRVEAAQGDGYKLHVRRCDTFYPWRPVLELYDLARDPDEQTDLSSEGRVEMGYLWARLTAARANAVVAPEQSPGVARDVMKTLPYLR